MIYVCVHTCTYIQGFEERAACDSEEEMIQYSLSLYSSRSRSAAPRSGRLGGGDAREGEGGTHGDLQWSSLVRLAGVPAYVPGGGGGGADREGGGARAESAASSVEGQGARSARAHRLSAADRAPVRVCVCVCACVCEREYVCVCVCVPYTSDRQGIIVACAKHV